jgi:hypothetical protein
VAVNETFGWLWLFTGVLTGLLLGLRFHEESWLGGYASHPRRLLRLGHVSFMGLGILNLLFAASASRTGLASGALALASWTMLIGGVTMPACCALVAWRRSLHLVFAVPVASLLIGVGLVAWGMVTR